MLLKQKELDDYSAFGLYLLFFSFLLGSVSSSSPSPLYMMMFRFEVWRRDEGEMADRKSVV